MSVFRSFGRQLARFFSNSTMDECEDVLYGSHQKLLHFIGQKKDKYKDEAIIDYFKSVSYPSVEDFEPGLEWFNVSEPLSFSKHLKGKVVVLDFFTYCCINCMHILPDLKEIENEFSVEDGLVVIGVHSAKFENEKISSNILAAVQRYNISHPVVNDHKSHMWQNCDVHCWPTLVIFGPNAKPLVMLTGEGHKDHLRLYIRNALAYYKSIGQISNYKIPFKPAFHLLPDLKGPLLFPGKITNTLNRDNKEIIAISDSGNNRILIADSKGTIVKQIGGKKLGFRDGTLEDAEFNSPQGLVFQSPDILFVADTENHAIRKINLASGMVETVAGIGRQGHDYKGGKLWKNQAISSPWDLCLYRTKDMNKIQDGDAPLKDVLIIAMAGTHQIWALFLDDIIWWKGAEYDAGTCIAIAGSGREENRNNQYPHAAAFAQPSGLALSKKNNEIYIADSESSSVRRLSLLDGKVTPVVGGDRNPNNLFAFGDKDGTLFEAKLQHSLGVAISKDEDTLFVADTYNHKVKKVDITKNTITTIPVTSTDQTDGQSHPFKEPAGLCSSLLENKLYLADTNNHLIKVLEFDTNFVVKNVCKLNFNLDDESNELDQTDMQVLKSNPLTISNKGGKLILNISLKFIDGLKLTEDAPQKWLVKVPNSTWSCVPSSGDDLKNIDFVVSVPPINKHNIVEVDFSLVTCTEETCLPKNFIVRLPVQSTNQGITSLSHSLGLHISPDKIIVN